MRLRWVPPGRFLMGSPGGETGRFDDESPQHEVVLAEGFWLGETVVTQTLWGAVMEANPSRVQGATLPVTDVSWNDAAAFLVRINSMIPDLGLCLPSEAQWEYA